MKNSPRLSAFLETKPKEYHKFDPSRFIQIYKDFKNAFFEIQAKVIHVVGTNGKGEHRAVFNPFIGTDQGFKVLHFTSLMFLNSGSAFI